MVMRAATMLLAAALAFGSSGCAIAWYEADSGNASDGTPYPSPAFKDAGCVRDESDDYTASNFASFCSQAMPQAWVCTAAVPYSGNFGCFEGHHSAGGPADPYCCQVTESN
jgi:hypothetical protein